MDCNKRYYPQLSLIHLIQAQFNLRMDIWMNGIKVTWGRHKKRTNNGKNTEQEFPLLLLMSVHCHYGISRGWWVQEPLYMSISLLLLLLKPHPTAVTLGQDQILSPLSHQWMPLCVTLCKYINSTASERGHYEQKREWVPISKALSYNMLPHACQSSPQRICLCEQMMLSRWQRYCLSSKGGQQW